MVLVDPVELRRTACQMAEVGAAYTAYAARLGRDLPLLPGADAVRVDVELGWAAARLLRLAAELEAEAAAQAALTTVLEAADAVSRFDVCKTVVSTLRWAGPLVGSELLTLLKVVRVVRPDRVLTPVIPFLGPVQLLLATAGDLYDFSPLGPRRRPGYLSTDFVGGVVEDVGLAGVSRGVTGAVGWVVDGGGAQVGEWVLGTVATDAEVAAPVLADGAVGAEAGSALPVAGTIAGAVVGLGMGLWLRTKPGQALESGVRRELKLDFDADVKEYRGAVRWLDRLGEGVLGGRSSPPAFPGRRVPFLMA